MNAIRTMRRRLSDDAGVALIMVMGMGMVLLLVMATAMSFAVSDVVKANTDQNWNGAISAAYAGVSEYESKLANNNAYVQYGNPAAAFSTGSTVTLPTGTQVNPAFGLGASGTWANVAGSAGMATFRYEVDNSQYSASGTLRIRSTGRVGNETRSIVANLKQQGFIDFLYFTDYEIQDPDQSGASLSCVKYGWAGRALPGSGGASGSGPCSDIGFGGGDVINGPMHSNDTLRICNATFTGIATTGNNPATGLRYLKQDSNGNGCSGQTLAYGVTYSPVVGMPSTNSQMKKETRTDLPTDVPLPGCLYTGPTRIVYNAGGTMTVRSPWTKFTNVTGDPATAGVNIPAKCGTVSTATGGLGSTGGATVPVLDNNLIYIQNVKAVASDPNYWPTSGAGSFPTVGYTATSCTTSNGIGYPMTNEVIASVSTTYGCRNGDAFVEGAVKGATTVATENFLYVTGDLTYTNLSSDILGLVGQNAVWVWNPVNSSNNNLLTDNRTINAAILSVAHTFQVQNYNRGGSQGTLTVNGAIAQKFRGIVRSGTNGYVKAYSYDQRFKYIAPPKFLSPVATTYGVSVLVEVKSAFTTTGAEIP